MNKELYSGKIKFIDQSELDYTLCDITYTDYGLFFNAPEGRLFIPYCSIKIVTQINTPE